MWELSSKIEHNVARIIAQQEINGVRFNKAQALEYIDELDTTTEALYQGILPELSKEIVVQGNPVMRPFLKNGDYSAQVKRWHEQVGFPIQVGGPFTRISFEDLRLSQTAKLKVQLERLGWQPTEWNFKDGERTSPKITEDSLESLDGSIGDSLKKWIILTHRRGQINGWITRVRPDGRLTAGAITCGANTGRMLHRTVVNVPKATSYEKGHEKAGELIWDIEDQPVIYGTQMRSLFTASEDRVLVGHDASGLELRILAHYLNDPEFTRELLEGDIHSFNQQKAGLSNRDQAKTFIYAFLYGAGPAKIGSIVGGGYKEGLELQRAFFAGLPRLKQLIDAVQKAARRGYLYGLDGRRLYIRGQHAALNTLLQGGGAVVMKLSMIYLDRWVTNRNLDVLKVIDMHDEAQADVVPEHAELYSQLAVQSIVRAGEYFNLTCPLDGESKIGQNWAQTH